MEEYSDGIRALYHGGIPRCKQCAPLRENDAASPGLPVPSRAGRLEKRGEHAHEP
jgi:hypothetical protein